MQILDTELFKKQIRNSVYTNNQQKAFTLQEQNDILNALNGITEIEFNKDGGVTKVFINNVEYSDALGNKAQAQLGTRVQNVGNLRGVFFNIFDKLNNGVEITSSPRRREEDDGIINKIVGLFR